ncbi:MAG: type III-A CRISPR-associated protein Csm2 [Nitrospinae bacterium]|nr:type III-A CRISPR-associated protein Csm2 [Nitrospinota bacterium]
MKKKCKICGKPLKDDSRFDTCYECGQKNKKEGGGDSDSLPPNYITKLENGYFDSSGCLWEEFITTMASDVAKSFGRKLKNHQLRRFYGHAKAAENRLRMTGDWDVVNLDVKKLGPFVSEAKGKDKIPQSFFDFIDKNIKSIKIQKDFEKGFMEHFQAIVAYFTYHYPKN